MLEILKLICMTFALATALYIIGKTTVDVLTKIFDKLLDKLLGKGE